MTRLEAINTLMEGPAMSALDTAIEAIRDHQERWGRIAEPEETDFTRVILGTLIELQVQSVERAVRLGPTMSNRLAQEAAEEKEAA